MFRNLTTLAVILAVMLAGCTSGRQEEILAHHPGGEKKEAIIFEGKGSNRTFLKRVEYFRQGTIKKEFAYKDNHFFGPWTFWYENGSKLAEGTITVKTLDPWNAAGNGAYFWPDGKKMIELGAGSDGKPAGVTAIYDETGKSFTAATCPAELKKKISEILEKWERA